MERKRGCRCVKDRGDRGAEVRDREGGVQDETSTELTPDRIGMR